MGVHLRNCSKFWEGGYFSSSKGDSAVLAAWFMSEIEQHNQISTVTGVPSTQVMSRVKVTMCITLHQEHIAA